MVREREKSRIMELPVFDATGQTVETLHLDEALWARPVNVRVLAQALHMYRAQQRAGTASTKTRARVSGGGKKPWRQKHTGRARAGSIRSPLWRHGGVTFGPHPRAFGYRLPKAIRRKVLDGTGMAPPANLIDLEMPAHWNVGDEEIIEWTFGFQTVTLPDPQRLEERWAAYAWAEFAHAYPQLELDNDRAAITRLHTMLRAA